MKHKIRIALLIALLALPLSFGLAACGEKDHVHDWGEWETVKEATCTEAGEEARICKKDGSHRETREIKPLGHNMTEIPAREASCAEDGYEAHVGCSRCGYSEEEYEWTPALHVIYEETDNGYTVSGLSEECSHTEIALPSIYGGKPVTSIGQRAFYDCDGLKSITIPDSVTSIGKYAFDQTAYYKDSSNWDENGVLYIGDHLIEANKTKGEYNIRQGTKTIACSAFEGCSGLTSVTIPNSVTSIGGGAFEYCSGLTGVYITDLSAWCGINFSNAYANPLYYAYRLYVNNAEVKTLKIPTDVKEIKAYAFEYCSGLTSVTIGSGVTSIGEYAFEDCSGLTSVTIGSGVTEIGDYAFEDCSGLTSVTIGSGVTSIGQRAFRDCSGLTSITIPNSVTKIGEAAFSGCSGLESMTIGSGVTSIGWSAFYNCNGLKSVVWNAENCTNAGSSYYPIFRYCANLKTVTFGENVKTIPAYALYGCSGLAGELKIPDSVTSIGGWAFQSCSGLTSITIPNSVTKIGWRVFYGCSGLESVTIGSGVTSIGYQAFYECTGLTSISIPDSVTEVGDYAFYDCSVLKSVTIGSGVTEIGDYAFDNCRGLNSVVIPDSVTEVGDSAFRYCSGLTSVTIGSGVTKIGSYAFSGCSGLERIEVTEGNANYSSQDGILYNKAKMEFIHIPKAIKGAVTIPDSVTSIGYQAFYGCSGLTSIAIPDSVTSIGESAFFGCSGLTSVTIGSGVTKIGSYAFSGCDRLERIEVTEGNANYSSQDGILYNKAKMEFIHIPKAIKGAVTIPDSVTSIGESAFFGCSGLQSVYYKGTPETWNDISISENGNYYLTRAAKYYFSDVEPDEARWQESENWWHYDGVTGEIAIWEKENA